MIAFETHTEKSQIHEIFPLEMTHSFFWCCLLPKKFREMLLRIGFLIYSIHTHQKKSIAQILIVLNNSNLSYFEKNCFLTRRHQGVFSFLQNQPELFYCLDQRNNISIVQMIKIKCFTIKLTTITQLSFWYSIPFSSNAYVFLMCYKSSFPR